VLSTKNATAFGGDLGKLMNQTTAGLVVTVNDCGTTNGIDLDPDDESIRGRVLAQKFKNYEPNTIVDKKLQGKIRNQKGKVLVRSALTCEAPEGVCSKCVGTLVAGGQGKLPSIGDSVGITASTSLGEPITQGALNTKHGGGAYAGKREFSGLDAISQVLQSPKVFPDKAELAQDDGRVISVEDAPQGGKIVNINNNEHYVPSGYEVLVKPGQEIMKGDQLSEGIVDPGEVVDLLGLGAGRRAYSETLKQIMEASKMGYVDKKNTELLARNAINHVQIDDPDGLGGYLPDDVVSYNKFQLNYSPPKDTRPVKVEEALRGDYFIQAPTLNFTIGTKINKKVASALKNAGIKDVMVSKEQPRFKSEMIRLRTASHSTNDDWLAKLQTSYLTDNLKKDIIRARDTDVESNVHFAPRLAVGEGFGKNVTETGKF
jgi:hypothetical protein